MDSPKTTSANTDVQTILDMTNGGFTDIRVRLSQLSLSKEHRILLFPEQDRKLFYKIVFGRWFLYLVIMLFLNNFYKWGVNYSDNQKEITLTQLQNDRIKKSWDYLYKNNNREVKRLMQDAYTQSEEKDK
jgi:hypothetical protein